MNLYLLTQNDNTNYDAYDSCVVCAMDEESAKNIHPDGCLVVGDDSWPNRWASHHSNIKCKLIGEAHPLVETGVVLASFNAG